MGDFVMASASVALWLLVFLCIVGVFILAVIFLMRIFAELFNWVLSDSGAEKDETRL